MAERKRFVAGCDVFGINSDDRMGHHGHSHILSMYSSFEAMTLYTVVSSGLTKTLLHDNGQPVRLNHRIQLQPGVKKSESPSQNCGAVGSTKPTPPIGVTLSLVGDVSTDACESCRRQLDPPPPPPPPSVPEAKQSFHLRHRRSSRLHRHRQDRRCSKHNSTTSTHRVHLIAVVA